MSGLSRSSLPSLCCIYFAAYSVYIVFSIVSGIKHRKNFLTAKLINKVNIKFGKQYYYFPDVFFFMMAQNSHYIDGWLRMGLLPP